MIIPIALLTHLFLQKNIDLSLMSTPFIPDSGATRLTRLALIKVSGADAISFLQGQLTNDIKALTETGVCLAGYCTPKGRLLATMLIWRDNDTLMLQVPLELQEVLQKRLQMFVLRAKVRLEHVSEHHTMLGFIGSSAAALTAPWFPSLPSSPYESVTNQSGTLLRVADACGVARYQWIVPKESGEQVWQTLSGTVPILNGQDWELSEIHAGIPHISIATQEKFVPQMINYELIGGVNFKKGCYPGQEIVARTHYLGKQKRRMVLAQVESNTVAAGTEVFAADDLTQPCGMVVNAAANHAGGSDCLIEIKTASYRQSTVQLQDGAVCHWLEMPYPLPDDAPSDQPIH